MPAQPPMATMLATSPASMIRMRCRSWVSFLRTLVSSALSRIRPPPSGLPPTWPGGRQKPEETVHRPFIQIARIFSSPGQEPLYNVRPWRGRLWQADKCLLRYVPRIRLVVLKSPNLVAETKSHSCLIERLTRLHGTYVHQILCGPHQKAVTRHGFGLQEPQANGHKQQEHRASHKCLLLSSRALRLRWGRLRATMCTGCCEKPDPVTQDIRYLNSRLRCIRFRPEHRGEGERPLLRNVQVRGPR